MSFRLEQSQKQIVSQKMLQSLSILQMNTQELTDYLEREALENPMVELEGRDFWEEDGERMKKLEWLDSLDEQNRFYYRYDREDMEENNGINNLGKGQGRSLADFLRLQLLGKPYGELEMEIFKYIALCLDSRGYFTSPAGEIAQVFQVTQEKAEECLSIMRELEPPGVCAASLKDCLQKQMEKRADCGRIEQIIVEKYLELLGKNQLQVIAKKEGLTLRETAEAAQRIKGLNPKPSQGFDGGEHFRYAVPDITVVKFQEHFELLVNDYAQPSLRMNREYLEMLKSDCGREVKEYLEQKAKRIFAIQECMNRRNTTLLSLTRVIVEVQKEFFLNGGNVLKPFRLQEAAEMLKIHETTVSRAIKGKYLYCCWGLYPLICFFPKEGSWEGAAEPRIKEKLKELIDREDKRNPHSDEKLAALLKEQGMSISRRTVAKYREEMQLANCRGRKEFIENKTCQKNFKGKIQENL